MEPVILPDARKHGVKDEDMLHAYDNAIRVGDIDDEGFSMLVGPRRDGLLIEVGVVRGDLAPVIVHAMYPARDKFLR